jgi:Ca2+-binding RTX toxin-like protein
MANYTPTPNDRTQLSNLLANSGLNAAQIMNGLGAGSTFEVLNSNQLGSISAGTDALFVTGGGTVNLRNLGPLAAIDLNLVVTQGNSSVDVQLPNLFRGAVVTGGGNDSISYAGVFGTRVATGAGNDTVRTGSGSDSVNAGSGEDSVNTGNGNDTVMAGSGNDTVDAGNGNDRVDAGEGNDSVNAGAGNDSVVAGAGNDTVDAGTGNDTVNGGAGNDSINAGAGNDSVIAGNGNDSVNAGTGNDRITVEGTSNNTVTIDGGLGIDRLQLSDLNARVVSVQSAGANGVTIQLSDNSTLHVTGVEQFAVDFNNNGSIGPGETVTLTGLLNHQF